MCDKYLCCKTFHIVSHENLALCDLWKKKKEKVSFTFPVLK